MSDFKHRVDVNSDITPTTQEKVESVDATDWSEKSLTELHVELTTLQNRLTIVQQMDKPEIIRQLQNGIQNLTALIQRKSNEKGDTLL